MQQKIFNMKQFLAITILSTSLLLAGMPSIVVAQTSPTPSVSPNPSSSANKLEQQINSLKERIASRVAQLKLVDKRGIMGKVTDVTDTQLTITDMQGSIRIIDVDELTKFSSPDAKGSFGISDIKKDMTIGVIGLYNKESRHLLARWVDVSANPIILSGAILSLDKPNYNFKLITPTNDQWTIDVENLTKTLSYTKEDGVLHSGFSKLQEKQRVMVVGFVDKQDPTKIVASRITVFPSLPINPSIVLIKQEDIAPVTPSTGSGKKLTPLTR